MKRCITLFLWLPACLWLAACASVQPLPADRLQHLLDDSAFAPPAASTATAIASAHKAVFELSEPMKQALGLDDFTRLRPPDPRQRLLQILHSNAG